ncbi:MAG: UDP-3-O-(3-hydroxymyristoyl)glucosamine N-acyltransferase [Phycisphaerales bacterium JB059]
MTTPGEQPSYTTGQLAEMLAASLDGPAHLELTSIDALDDAAPGSLSFIRSDHFARRWPSSRASAALVTGGVDVPGHDPSARALLVVDDADQAMVALLEALTPEPHLPPVGVHPSSVVDPSATIHPEARVGPLCVVGAGARIDAHATLVARVTLGRDTRLGEASILHPGVVLQDACAVGRHSALHPGVMVGADGFGYIPGPDGYPRKVPHLGNVVIGDHVEIGANTCIDRAKFGATTIEDHAKIDNLVQIGHNCTVGRGAIICGAAALAGSVKIGPGAIIGGMSALAEQSSVGARARLGGGAQLISHIPDAETYVGQPAGPAKETMANYAAFRRLASTIRELRAALRDQP